MVLRSKKRKVASDDAMRNAVDTLYANIRFSDVDNEVTSLVITSSVPNEGKSTVAVALATAMSKSGKRTLLVECDMRCRSLAHLLDLHSLRGGGVFALVSGAMRETEAIQGTAVSNLYFLDAEPGIPNPSDLLGSEKFSRLLVTLERSFDYVILDTPPLGGFVDAAVLAARADAALLVARENVVKRKDLLAAKEQLEKSGARILGVVMNACEDSASDYYYRSHYRDK